jgi:hypothetical protein
LFVYGLSIRNLVKRVCFPEAEMKMKNEE